VPYPGLDFYPCTQNQELFSQNEHFLSQIGEFADLREKNAHFGEQFWRKGQICLLIIFPSAYPLSIRYLEVTIYMYICMYYTP